MCEKLALRLLRDSCVNPQSSIQIVILSRPQKKVRIKIYLTWEDLLVSFSTRTCWMALLRVFYGVSTPGKPLKSTGFFGDISMPWKVLEFWHSNRVETLLLQISVVLWCLIFVLHCVSKKSSPFWFSQ